MKQKEEGESRNSKIGSRRHGCVCNHVLDLIFFTPSMIRFYGGTGNFVYDFKGLWLVS